MQRYTMKMLENLVERINQAAGTPLTYTDKRVTPFKSLVGHYHIDCAYSGYKLVQTCNEGGGIRDISQSGYTTKRELYAQMRMFLMGIEETRAA